MSLADEYAQRCRTQSDIYEHLPTLFDTVLGLPHERSQPVVLELGVRTGNSTAAFLHALQVRKAGMLYSVDLDMPDVPGEWFDNPQWTFIRSDSTARDLIDFTGPKHIDVLFIDTSHTLVQTYAELHEWWAHMRPGGTILLHDTETAGCEVKEAMLDFCAGRRLEWSNDQRCYGLGTIRVPA
jgi:predicted O-methyltransferase YrrM